MKSNHLVIVIILVATWLRFWQLNTTPPGLWFDEAYNGMDAIWLRDTNSWQIFLPGNNGRETLYFYMLTVATAIWGETAYTLRFVSAWLGVLTIPVMYRWLLILPLSTKTVEIRWMALLGTTGLALSFWAVLMNRTAYRANLLPLFVVATSYMFWQGWRTGRIRDYIGAGILLGLAQYSYFSARLLPLVFGIFVISQTKWLPPSQRKTAWRGLISMAVVSSLVALPILIFMANNPNLAWGRVQEVAIIQDRWQHFLEALLLFWNSQDPNWRHHLIGYSMFSWFSTIGFIVGLLTTIYHFQQPAYMFIAILLFIMWLPAPLSTPPVHTLRLAGILPAYYTIVTIGLFSMGRLVNKRLPNSSPKQLGISIFILLLLVNGSSTSYHYFGLWANSPEVHQSFDSDIVKLAQAFTESQTTTDTVIPFYLYTHATMRYLLDDTFKEEILFPASVKTSQTTLTIPAYPPNDGKPPAFVWLKKNAYETGHAYVSVVNRQAPFDVSPPIIDIAIQHPISTTDLLPYFPLALPNKKADFMWADNLHLTGYQFISNTQQLVLTWQILGYTGLKERMFLQLVDYQNQPIAQFQLDSLSRKMYRWRPDNVILEQHNLPDLPVGQYFARLGYFDPKTLNRLPIYNHQQILLGDTAIIGPLLMDGTKPDHQLNVRYGDVIKLLGYSLSSIENGVLVTLHWQSLKSTTINYTVFIQSLDEHNQVIVQIDQQPFEQLYPTSVWQPGDILYDQFLLPGPQPETRLITGLYDVNTGERLPIYDVDDNLLVDRYIKLQ